MLGLLLDDVLLALIRAPLERRIHHVIDHLRAAQRLVKLLKIVFRCRELEVVEDRLLHLHRDQCLLERREVIGQVLHVLLELGHLLNVAEPAVERALDGGERLGHLRASHLDLVHDERERRVRDRAVLVHKLLAHRHRVDGEHAHDHRGRDGALNRIDLGELLLDVRLHLRDALLLLSVLDQILLEVEAHAVVVLVVEGEVLGHGRERLLEHLVEALPLRECEALGAADRLQHGRVAPKESLHHELLELRQVLHRADRLIVRLEHRVDEGLRLDAVRDALAVLDQQARRKERRQVSARHRLEPRRACHLRGRGNCYLPTGARDHEVGVRTDRGLRHEDDAVLHHKVDHAQEALELRHRVHLGRLLLEVEPALAHVLEPIPDDGLERVRPCVFEVRDGGCKHSGLLLGDLLVREGLGEPRREQRHREHLVALGAHLLRARDDLGLGEEGMECEALLLMQALMSRNLNESRLGHGPPYLGRGHHQREHRVASRPREHAERRRICRGSGGGRALVEDDGGHGAGVLELHLVHERGGVELVLLELGRAEREREHPAHALLLHRG